jgi:hypothetical protein
MTLHKGLALTLALLGAALLPAQEPLPPLGQPNIHPARVVALATGSSSAACTGSWTALAVTLSGSLPEIAAWDFRGPLSSRYGRQSLGAQKLFLTGFGCTCDLSSALAELAVLQAGDDGHPDGLGCWSLIDTDRVRAFPEAYKQAGVIRDGHDISVGLPETTAYSNILALAYYTSPSAFRNAARRDLTYAQIFAEPAEHRGQVVHIEGRLKRLSRLEPPLEAKAQGVSDLYEAWIFNDAYGLNPFCALFTQLPMGLKDRVGEGKVGGIVEVSFDGYFYKKFRYKAADSRERTARDAPVFIGRTLVPRSQPSTLPAEDDWGNQVMAIFLGVVGSAVVVVVGLTWWFRHTDERVRRRLAVRQPRELVLPPPADAPFEDFSGPVR